MSYPLGKNDHYDPFEPSYWTSRPGGGIPRLHVSCGFPTVRNFFQSKPSSDQAPLQWPWCSSAVLIKLLERLLQTLATLWQLFWFLIQSPNPYFTHSLFLPTGIRTKPLAAARRPTRRLHAQSAGLCIPPRRETFLFHFVLGLRTTERISAMED